IEPETGRDLLLGGRHDVLRCARLFCFRKIGFEFLEGAAPAHAHAVATGLKSLALFSCRVMRLPADGELGLATGQFLEGASGMWIASRAAMTYGPGGEWCRLSRRKTS